MIAKRTLGLLLSGVVAMACAAESQSADTSDPGTDTSPYDTQESVGTYALGGTIITPKGPQKGYVVVTDEKITAIVSTKAQVPAGTRIVDTGGVISPGFMDLHNHVAYNFLPLWNSGQRFKNRYQWSGISGYDTVKKPYNAVKAAGDACAGLKYGEFRSIVGGTTTIQGSVDLACARSWTRNVEFVNFCEDHIRQDVLPINGISPADAATLNAQFTSGQTKAFFVHLAEGTDDKSRTEFEQLRGLGLLKPQVVGIHSTALNEAQLQEMGHIGMKIIWSPLSNMILYGKTTNIPVAMKAGVKVAIAPDWSPSGSANVLGELKVADRVNREQFGNFLTDQQLVEMVTSIPSQIAGMDDKLGAIEVGKFADLVVLRGNVDKPYRAVIDAKPADVLLTTVSGEAFYGKQDILTGIGSTRTFSTVDACGEPRQLSVVETNPKVTNGTESLEAINAKFTKDGVTDVIPLFQCGAAPEFAFATLPLPK
jgi:5-methylthioadenosine/S-adenosylhomocysteine deaminase